MQKNTTTRKAQYHFEAYFRTMFELSGTGEGTYKEKGSKFLSFAYTVVSETDVKEFLQKLKNEHHQARHHCYAFIIGKNQEHQRWSDAGEPSNTAGPPIHGQILSAGLTNTLVVVVRYFGGTKLGKPGLVHAYKEAAASAIENAPRKIFIPYQRYRLTFDYATTSPVNLVLNKIEGLVTVDSQYGEKTSLTIDIPEHLVANALTLLNHIEGISVVPDVS